MTSASVGEHLTPAPPPLASDKLRQRKNISISLCNPKKKISSNKSRNQESNSIRNSFLSLSSFFWISPMYSNHKKFPGTGFSGSTNPSKIQSGIPIFLCGWKIKIFVKKNFTERKNRLCFFCQSFDLWMSALSFCFFISSANELLWLALLHGCVPWMF